MTKPPRPHTALARLRPCVAMAALAIAAPAFPHGACILPDGSCIVLSTTDCQDSGGTYQGEKSACDPNNDGNLEVPGEFTTIQAAINGAYDGDDITLEPGIYNEAIDLLGKAVAVQSTDPDDPDIVLATVIDATGLGSSVVRCTSGETEFTQLIGLTLTGGTGSPDSQGEITGGGIHVFQSSPQFFQCRIEGNTSPEDGAGMYVDGGAPGVIVCTFVDNAASDDGGGVAVRGGGALLAISSIFEGNSAAGDGGAIRIRSGALEVIDCQFLENTALIGGAIEIHVADAVVSISDSIFCANQPDDIVGPFSDGGDNFFNASCDADSDGDGLLDIWEIDGIDGDGDGQPDFELPGADPERKDLYVEVDAMAGFGLSDSAVLLVETSFASAPVSNPGPLTGVALHIGRDESDLPHIADWATGSGCWPLTFDAVKADHFGTPDDSDAVKAAKALAYRYCIVADRSINDDGHHVGGCGERPGNDFVIFIGRANGTQYEDIDQAAVFMHELGHNLGLGHGGGDSVNYKVNYPSIMNYAFNYRYEYNRTYWRLDYCRHEFGLHDEIDLDETAGIADPDGFYDHVRLPFGVNVPNPPGFARELRYARLDGDPIDFGDLIGNMTQDGSFSEGVEQDLNWLGLSVPKASEPSEGDILAGQNDWEVLQYAVPQDSAPGPVQFPEELTEDEVEWIDQNFPIPPCLADFNGSNAVDVYDLLALLAEWGSSDTRFDLDGSGAADVGDLLEVLGQWGPCDG